MIDCIEKCNDDDCKRQCARDEAICVDGKLLNYATMSKCPQSVLAMLNVMKAVTTAKTLFVNAKVRVQILEKQSRKKPN